MAILGTPQAAPFWGHRCGATLSLSGASLAAALSEAISAGVISLLKWNMHKSSDHTVEGAAAAPDCLPIAAAADEDSASEDADSS